MFHGPALPSKQAGHGRRARSEAEARLLLEAPSGMREHRVDLAGVGGEIVARHRRTALAARNVVDEPLELVDVLLHGLPELGVAAIFATGNDVAASRKLARFAFRHLAPGLGLFGLGRSAADAAIAADIADETILRGLVTQAMERVTRGFSRRALMRPIASGAWSAMTGRIVIKSVAATTSQIAGRVSISSRGAKLKPASSAASSRMRLRP